MGLPQWLHLHLSTSTLYLFPSVGAVYTVEIPSQSFFSTPPNKPFVGGFACSHCSSRSAGCHFHLLLRHVGVAKPLETPRWWELREQALPLRLETQPRFVFIFILHPGEGAHTSYKDKKGKKHNPYTYLWMVFVDSSTMFDDCSWYLITCTYKNKDSRFNFTCQTRKLDARWINKVAMLTVYNCSNSKKKNNN